MAERILEHFSLAPYFDAVCGALRAGCRADFLVLENETNAAGDPVIAGVFCGGEEIREERTPADHG